MKTVRHLKTPFALGLAACAAIAAPSALKGDAGATTTMTASTSVITATSTVTAYPAIGGIAAAPAAPYVKGGYYVAPGRAAVRLSGVSGIQVVKPLANGRIAVLSSSGLTIHSSTGALASRFAYAKQFTTNDAGTRIAYTHGSTVRVVTNWGTVIRTRTSFSGIRAVGFRGADVFVVWSARTYVWSGRDNGLYRWSSYRATTVSEATGRIALIMSVSDDYRTCYQLADSRGAAPRPVYNRCGTFYPVHFSAAPGRYLLGTPAPEGFLPGLWQVARPSDGAILLRIDERRHGGIGVLDAQVTNDGGGVVVNVVKESPTPLNAIVRCNWSGACGTMTPALSAKDIVNQTGPAPYLLVSH